MFFKHWLIVFVIQKVGAKKKKISTKKNLLISLIWNVKLVQKNKRMRLFKKKRKKVKMNKSNKMKNNHNKNNILKKTIKSKEKRD